MPTNIIKASELHEIYSRSGVRLIDASWYMPADNINCREQFISQHIPGAVFFDIDQICDQSSELPHMLPSAAHFAHAVGELGISNDDELVIYDTSGLFSAARVWWMFQVFGHAKVRILDGGLPAWLAEGFAVEAGQPDIVERHFTPMFNHTKVINKVQMIANSESAECVVLDARSLARFEGSAPEPRPGLSSGHIPNSTSLPFNTLVNQGRLKSSSELREIFGALGIDHNTQVITTCGSGVTAAIISLALHEAGYGFHGLYDGAWVEWASSQDTTILTLPS